MQPTVEKAFNTQIRHELDSGYLYLSMSAHFEAANLPGFARWMRLQAQEELDHAMRLYDHVVERGGRVVLQGIEKPQSDFGAPLSIFEAALAHEKKITALIEKLYETVVAKKDYAAQLALQWFIKEQVEEEQSAGTVVEQLKLVGDNPAALLMLDRQLGARAGGD
ncbi:MAG: ferritin [Gemmatimonadota bacterium]|jgi:ferritin